MHGHRAETIGARPRGQERFAVARGRRFTSSFAKLKSILSIIIAAAFAAALLPGRVAAQENPAQSLVDAALADLTKKRYDEALKKLEEADKLAPNSPFILNLFGAIYTKKKDFDTARGYFEKALEAQSDFFPAKFNLGELLFLQKQYPQALDYFSRMLRENPNNELLQFKVILCLLQTRQIDEAKRLIAQMKFPGQEPAWYFAKAALAVAEGDKRKASEFLGGAEILYKDKTTLYRETFQDLGWPVK